jgi:hypothetical protein
LEFCSAKASVDSVSENCWSEVCMLVTLKGQSLLRHGAIPEVARLVEECHDDHESSSPEASIT